MGYLSDWDLRIYDEDLNPVHRDTLNLHKHTIGIISEYGDGLWVNSVKWYDNINDMTLYAEDHPQLLFELRQTGEDREQQQHFFRGDKEYTNVVQPVWNIGQPVWPEPDLSLL